MQPSDLKVESFHAYRPVARKTAADYLSLLQQLPIGFLPFLLKEIISFDWKFPAEREELLQQLAYLESLSSEARNQEMAAFAQLRFSPALQDFDWVNMPGQFLERLSSELWSSAQMDSFRTASQRYMHDFRTAHPEVIPPTPRVAIVLIGQGVGVSPYRLFRKLRRQGTYFGKVEGTRGLDQALGFLQSRAAAQPMPYAHWFIEGGETSIATSQVCLVSYQGLSDVRESLTSRMQKAFETGMSPEAFRTMLAEITPEELGMTPQQGDPVLNRFKVTLFTEGSGTQIYSTTFVQWTAREALRRAQPITLVARFTPRQRQASMNELLSGELKHAADPAGSLVDADMGAWYTWIDLQRLPGADQSSFLVWFEDHEEAVAVGPTFAKAAEDNSPVQFAELLKRLAGASVSTRV